ncbi:hypothetical protein FGF67_13590 [Tamlana fucoidanivorans]|uniref:Uncharacterized protein n=1 Tax=Allotamlana fucoidanivorans TaxID=2583814 RepID=A0A5C4SGP4_9FLAO|nr:hypothetical protein FGF67_13590 [Tamlana fucoidanivorans]
MSGCKSVHKENNALNVNRDNKPNILIIFPDQLRRYSACFWSESPYKGLVQGKSEPLIMKLLQWM